jgi:predicted transcriptional regulator
MKLLLYCCKTKPQLSKVSREYVLIKFKDNQNVFEALNGKIVAECDFEVEKLQIVYGKGWETKTIKGTENIEKLTCLSRDELYQYCKGNGYAIYIKNLHIFDEPRDIRNYYNIAARTMQDYMNQKALVKAPQNMCNAYDVYKNHYILISIQSQWMCKILNGEKTIEVRKKILKEMLNNE